MNSAKISLVIILGVLIGMDYACMKEQFDPNNYDFSLEWTPTFEGPVAYGNLSLNNMLNRFDSTGLIYTDTTGLIIFTYEGGLNQITAQDWITIPPQLFKEVLFSTPEDIPGPVFGSPGTLRYFPIADKFQFVFNKGERFDSIMLEEGSLYAHVTSTIRHTGNIYLSSPYIIMPGGDTLNDIIPISDPSGTFTSTTSISLNGSKLMLDNSIPDSSLIPINFVLVINASGNDILASEGVNISLNFGELKMTACYGSVGHYDTLLLENQELDINLFQGKFTGMVKFNNPRLKMYAHNSFGVPIGFGFENVKAQMKDGSASDLILEQDLFILGAPDRNHIGESVSSVISINRDSSNIGQLFSSNLEKLVYSVRLVTNPPQGGDPSDNFFLKTSEVALDYEFQIPMNLRISDLVLVDTINFKLGGDSSSQQLDINALQVKIETDNGMPVDVDLQVYFVDSLYQVLDSLYSDGYRQILTSGDVDPVTLRIIAPSNNVSTINLTREDKTKIDNILDAFYALIQARVVTTNGGQSDVRFFSDYSIGYRLGARVDLAIKTTDEGN